MQVIVCSEHIHAEQVLSQYRVQNPEAQVIYCASEDQLRTALAQLPRENIEKERRFAVKTREGMRILMLSEILLCRCEGHRYYVQLHGGEQVDSLTIRRAFSTIMEPLTQSGRFLQCNSSTVVSIPDIRFVHEDYLVLHDGTTLSFPIKRQHMARQALGIQ